MTAAPPVVACDFALSAYDARERARAPVHGKCVRFNCLFGPGNAKVNRETVSPGVRGARQRRSYYGNRTRFH